jgi:hypothetical protein
MPECHLIKKIDFNVFLREFQACFTLFEWKVRQNNKVFISQQYFRALHWFANKIFCLKKIGFELTRFFHVALKVSLTEFFHLM